MSKDIAESMNKVKLELFKSVSNGLEELLQNYFIQMNPLLKDYVEFRHIGWGDSNVIDENFVIVPSMHKIDITNLIGKFDITLIQKHVKEYIDKKVMDSLLLASEKLGSDKLSNAIKIVAEGFATALEQDDKCYAVIRFGLGFKLE